MKQKHLMEIGTDAFYDDVFLTFDELCHACHMEEKFITTMVTQGVIEPLSGELPEEWQFSIIAVRRVRLASRIARELLVTEENLALVLQLLDEIYALREKVAMLERQLF